jgi:hypothetical protein
MTHSPQPPPTFDAAAVNDDEHAEALCCKPEQAQRSTGKHAAAAGR